MRKFKKACAGLIALSMVAGMTGITASAETDIDSVKTAVNAGTGTEMENYVASLDDGIEQEVGLKCIDEGISLEDTEDLIAMCDSDIMTASDDTDIYIDAPYYSTVNRASTQHYINVVNIKPSEYIEGADILFKFPVKYLKYGDNLRDFDSCVRAHNAYFVDGDTTTQNAKFCLMYYERSHTTPTSIFSFAVNPTSTKTTEAKLFNNITFTVDGSKKIRQELYAIGDVDHNGIVNDDDATYIMGLNISKDYTFDYQDGAHYSYQTSRIAADFNEDNEISLSDVIALNQYLAAEND